MKFITIQHKKISSVILIKKVIAQKKCEKMTQLNFFFFLLSSFLSRNDVHIHQEQCQTHVKLKHRPGLLRETEVLHCQGSKKAAKLFCGIHRTKMKMTISTYICLLLQYKFQDTLKQLSHLISHDTSLLRLKCT